MSDVRLTTEQRDQITVTRAGLGESYESKIKMFFDEYVTFPLAAEPGKGLWELTDCSGICTRTRRSDISSVDRGSSMSGVRPPCQKDISAADHRVRLWRGGRHLRRSVDPDSVREGGPDRASCWVSCASLLSHPRASRPGLQPRRAAVTARSSGSLR